MPHAPSHERPPAATSEPSEPARRSEEEASAEVVAPVEEPDPFDALWDPDMDTRYARRGDGRGKETVQCKSTR